MRSQISESVSDANSLSSRELGPLCNCGRPIMVVKSWTDENPGRRFCRCGVHGFFIWADKEPPYGWQKQSLLEARDEMRRQKEEIKVLKESVRGLKKHVGSVRGQTNNLNTNVLNNHEEENKRLVIDDMAGIERENLLRQFLVSSWEGFFVAIAMLLTMGK